MICFNDDEEYEILNDPNFIKGYQDYIDGNLIEHDDVKELLFNEN